MRLVLPRYLLTRWLAPLAGALLFFGGLILANEVVALSRDIFRQGASFQWLFPLLVTTLPESLAMILPMAAVLGGLLGTQHLVQGSELVACQGLGAGRAVILRPFVLLASLLLVSATVNSNLLVPYMAKIQTNLRGKMLEEARTRFLRPGAPPWVPPNAPSTAMWVAPDGQLHVMEVTETSTQHLVASQISWFIEEKDKGSTSLVVELQDLKGTVFQRQQNRPMHIGQDSQRMEFEIPASARLFPSLPTRYLATGQLLTMRNPDARVELSRRFSLPVAAAALLLLGISLGLGHPRFQKGAALLKSLGSILAYYLVLKFFENQIFYGKRTTTLPLYLLPWFTLLIALWLLNRKLKPHHSLHFHRILPQSVRNLFARPSFRSAETVWKRWIEWRKRWQTESHHEATDSVLARWTRAIWWKAWGGTLATMLVLSLLIEFANLAGEISKYKIPFSLFASYWLWNLPPFFSVALPVAFLLGGVLAFSEAAANREWVALRAGGVSLLNWMISGWKAWGSVLLLGLVIPVFIEPLAYTKADIYYRQILQRSPRVTGTTRWLHLGNTGVLWYLDGSVRWGFPLHPPKTAPVLLKWEMGWRDSTALPWGGLGFVRGLSAQKLFPDASLQRSATAEETSTMDLYQWQQWAPNPERASMLWSRLLNWIAGPALLFGALSFAFPPPRGGRGQALGAALVLGLAYLGLQALFSGAARSSQIPPFWGVAGPMVLLAGFGLLRLRFVKT